MFNFFKCKETPDGLGEGLALGFAEFIPQIDKIVLKRAQELNLSSDEQKSLFTSLFLIYEASIQFNLQASDVSKDKIKATLFSFWGTLGNIIIEAKGQGVAVEIQSKSDAWFKKYWELICKPPPPPSPSMGKLLFDMSFPNRHQNDNLVAVIILDLEFKAAMITCSGYVCNVLRGIRLIS